MVPEITGADEINKNEAVLVAWSDVDTQAKFLMQHAKTGCARTLPPWLEIHAFSY